MSLILQFKYHQNNQIVKIEFSNDVLAYLLNNTLGYTRFSQETLFSLSSPYTARIYKVISHWQDKKNGFKRCFTLSFLRKIFALGQKYTATNSMLTYIILSAQRELKEKADIWFEILDTIKEGRKVVGWQIAIYKKETSKSSLPKADKPKAVLETPKHHIYVARYGLSKKQAKKIEKFFRSPQRSKTIG